MSYLLRYIVAFLVFTARICFGNRELTAIVNPECSRGGENLTNAVYVKAVGAEDTIHYLWSANGTFSMLLAKTSKEAELFIDCDKYFSSNSSNSINFTQPPFQSSVVLFTTLYQYDDAGDVVDITLINHNLIQPSATAEMDWNPVSVSSSTDQVTAKFSITTNESLQLILYAFGSDGHASQLPSLVHNSDSFQLEILLKYYEITTNHTRFAVEMAAFDDIFPAEDVFAVKKQKSIDDEYTPGVFITYSMKSVSSPEYSFLQWKPVCYTGEERTTEYTTDTWQRLNDNVTSSDERSKDVNSSLAYALFGANASHLLTGWLSMSFGQADDKYYTNTNFSSWTVLIGMGTPPDETFSTLVIVVIIVGFGVPALLILIGGVVILVRRFRRKDDDLNLSDTKLFEEEE